MEHNLETLRTRLTQVADLRDAQGIREDHRALVARLTEVEERASVHTLREFMSKIHKLESMLSGEHGGVIGEAIRACNRRLDNHRATMDDFYARISMQDWYHDLSDQEENEETRLSTHDVNAKSKPTVMHHLLQGAEGAEAASLCCWSINGPTGRHYCYGNHEDKS